MAPKSILKKASTATEVPTPDNAQGSQIPPNVNPQHYQLALHHAKLIQARKDAEAKILEALEEMIEFPKTPTADPARPSPTDLARFQELIEPFQPSDYDALFEERNCVDKCAYVLCPRALVRDHRRGQIRLTRSVGPDRALLFVPKGQAEMWCSPQCARRAMFVKVQLSELPAWERLGSSGKPVEVLDETGEAELEARLRNVRLDDDGAERLEKAMEELALERGESKGSGKPGLVMDDLVKEKSTVGTPLAPSIPKEGASAGSIDGYMPRKS